MRGRNGRRDSRFVAINQGAWAKRLGKNFCRSSDWGTIRSMTNRNFKVGQTREQGSFLPPRIEDYVAADNPVRAIEAYVCALDLAALGFRHAGGDGGAGQPP